MSPAGALEGRALLEGDASGTALVLDEPLSFWGGLDSASGRIIDRRHPQVGERVTGRVLVLPAGRGSSSSSTVLAEAMRRGTAPAALLLAEADGIVVVGGWVGALLYGTTMPIVRLTRDQLARIRTGDTVEIRGSHVTVTR